MQSKKEKEIVRIVIKSESGFFLNGDGYKDKITITANSISYERNPSAEPDEEPVTKWSYRTNRVAFQQAFDELKRLAPTVLYPEVIPRCLDVGELQVIVTYSDKSKEKVAYFCTTDCFAAFFCTVSAMVPGCERLPDALRDVECIF